MLAGNSWQMFKMLKGSLTNKGGLLIGPPMVFGGMSILFVYFGANYNIETSALVQYLPFPVLLPLGSLPSPAPPFDDPPV